MSSTIVQEDTGSTCWARRLVVMRPTRSNSRSDRWTVLREALAFLAMVGTLGQATPFSLRVVGLQDEVDHEGRGVETEEEESLVALGEDAEDVGLLAHDRSSSFANSQDRAHK